MAQRSMRGLNDSSLKCRSWNHMWDHTVTFIVRYKARKAKRTGDALEVYLVCKRCGTGRVDLYTYTRPRRLITRRYTYAPNYLVGGIKDWGGRMVFNENVRDELIGRISKGAKRREVS